MSDLERRPLKCTTMLRRRIGITEDAFHTHWTKVHAPIVSGWLKRHVISRYTQFHTPSSFQGYAVRNIGSLSNDYIAPYDGFVEMVMPHVSCFDSARLGRWNEVFSPTASGRESKHRNPYYEEVVKPDEEKFQDLSSSKVIFGWEEVYIEQGEIQGAVA